MTLVAEYYHSHGIEASCHDLDTAVLTYLFCANEAIRNLFYRRDEHLPRN